MIWVKPFVVEGKKIQGYLTPGVMRRQKTPGDAKPKSS
jgi:hypothetical protein